MTQGWRFDAVSGELQVDGAPATRLRPRSAAVLECLLRRRGRVVAKDELLREVWRDVVVTDDSLVQCVTEIRRALGPPRRDWIRTIARSGYAFVGDVPIGSDDEAPAPAAHAARVSRRATAPHWPRASAAVALMLLLLGLGPPGDVPRSWRAGTPLTLVVLPFSAIGPPDGAATWLADGITEELTTDIARLPDTLVIARRSADVYRPARDDVAAARDIRHIGAELGVRYAVEGSVQRTADRVAVHARLVDAHSALQVWSERIDVPRASLPDLQRDIGLRIARALQLQTIELEAARARHTPDPDAYDLVMQGQAALHRYTPESTEAARALFRRACVADAALASAWVGLAHADLLIADRRWGRDTAPFLAEAEQAIARGQQIDARAYGLHAARGRALLFRGRVEDAVAALELEIASNPHASFAYDLLALARLAQGEPERAIAPTETAMRLSPRDPDRSGQWRRLARAKLYAGDTAGAVDAARHAAAEPNPHRLAQLTLAGALMMAGRDDEARQAMEAFRSQHPDFTQAHLAEGELSVRPTYRQMVRPFREAVARAGLPAG